MITTTYNKEINLLTAVLTEKVCIEDISSLTKSIQNKEVKTTPLRILVHAQCEETSLTPTNIYWWTEKYSNIFERFTNTKLAIVAIRPLFVALSQIFKYQINLNNTEIEIFSNINNASKYLKIESYILK
ncbi:hypothetical protein E9993_13355 [Labilibacter sediminis]|nr:hypothetical protein E9993_13355 [Labilibacter sediminis]